MHVYAHRGFDPRCISGDLVWVGPEYGEVAELLPMKPLLWLQHAVMTWPMTELIGKIEGKGSEEGG